MTREYEKSVFINCPFDLEYKINLASIIFTSYRCGFYPITTLNADNALEDRLSKIKIQIKESKFGIHDISRIELNPEGLPRFNMPFELGLFFGAKTFGNKLQKSKVALVFEGRRFSYQKILSDLNGIDVYSHENKIQNIIRNLRNWFNNNSTLQIPGYNTLIKDFQDFRRELRSIINKAGMDWRHLSFNDLCLFIEEYLKGRFKTLTYL